MIIAAKLKILFPDKSFRVSEIFIPGTGTKFVLSIDAGVFEGIFPSEAEMYKFIDQLWDKKFEILRTCNKCGVQIPKIEVLSLCNKCLMEMGPQRKEKNDENLIVGELYVDEVIKKWGIEHD